MRRVSGPGGGGGEEDPLEALETEGERQLRTLLRTQLDTSASLEQCVSKRRRFAPAALYKPFGEEAAGTHSLSQFQELQESNRETDSLRELGLSEAEIHLWKSSGASAGAKGSGLGAAPEATEARIQAIQTKIAERQEILSLPQRFAGSKQLSRREMEIEKALFQGTDRHSFLRMLYHQEDTGSTPAPTKDPLAHLETLCQDLLRQPSTAPLPPPRQEPPDSTCSSSPSGPLAAQDSGSGGGLVVAEPVDFVPEEEIVQNRLSEDEIRSIPRFSSYTPGEPSEVLYLKNLSRQVTVRDLLSVFARFQEKEGAKIRFRLFSGRMRAQAFLTFPNVSSAVAALRLANGFRLRGKPLIIEFGRNKSQATGPGPGPGTLPGP